MKLAKTMAMAGLMLVSVPAAQAADAADAATGEKIFNQVCSHCHNTTAEEKIGPGLAGVTKRRPIEWIDTWLKNPGELLKTDEYAQKLRKSNKLGMTMPAIPEMKDDNMRASIIEFLKTLK